MHAVNEFADGIDHLAKPNDLLVWFQKTSPELLAEDAFVVPSWFFQQRTWVEDPSNSDSRIYNYPLLLRIRGSLEQDILQRSLQEIVRRHEVLRSVFRVRHGELIQIVVPPEKLTLGIVDLTKAPEAERESRIQQIALEAAHEPVDLARGPLFRSTLIRIGADDHVLQLITHHIVHDDWSTGILFRDLSELYDSMAEGRASPLRDSAFQYGDYVRWHQEQVLGNALASKLSYWKQQLASDSAFQHLATDFARPARCTDRGARERIELPADLINSLKALSRQERISLFMVLLAGFQCLLHRYSKHEEIGIASCAANRPLVEVEGLIGRFGNDILLRTSLSGNPTFRELLVRVRETCLSAYSYQDLPFGKLLKEVTNGADPNQQLPFQVMFILQNAPKENRQIQGLSMNWIPFYTGTAKYDLNVWLKIGSTLEVILEYRTDLFRAATMKSILSDYQSVLQYVAKNAGIRIHDLITPRKPNAVGSAAVSTMTEAIRETTHRMGSNDDVQSSLVEIWQMVFRIRLIGIDEDFFELGGDSLLAARLFAQIEKTFQVNLPLATLLEAPTIRQMAGLITRPKTGSSGSSLVIIQPTGTKPPLFFVHPHTGIISHPRKFAHALGPDQPLYGLRAQGVEGEQPHKSVEEMAAHCVQEIHTMQPKGPYFLSGLCFGGMVAYELARLLKAEGEEIAFLALLNTPSPGSLKGWTYLITRMMYEIRKLRALPLKEKLDVFSRKTAEWLRGSFERAFWRVLRQSSNLGAAKGARRSLSVENLSVLAAEAYNPGSYAGRITLFLTGEVGSRYAVDPEHGWAELAQGGIEVYRIRGDNFTLFDEKNIQSLGEQLQFCLEGARGNHKEPPPVPSRKSASGGLS